MIPIKLNMKPWCTCHSTGRWQRQDGYTFDPVANLWVHTRRECRKPSKMNYERFVLGLTQVPQRSGPVDIYDLERQLDAKREIRDELGWDNEDEDGGYNWEVEDDEYRNPFDYN